MNEETKICVKKILILTLCTLIGGLIGGFIAGHILDKPCMKHYHIHQGIHKPFPVKAKEDLLNFIRLKHAESANFDGTVFEEEYLIIPKSAIKFLNSENLKAPEPFSGPRPEKRN